MRSHPYSPPPPLPPILDELASILPNQTPRRHSPTAGFDLLDLDPETSQLLPLPAARRKRHHVRVQGRLALVRSISTADLAGSSSSPLGSAEPGSAGASRFESAVGSVVSGRRGRGHGRRRRRSLDECEVGEGPWARDADLLLFDEASEESESETEENERETVLRDTQLRGYGIGGVGNIRMSPRLSGPDGL